MSETIQERYIVQTGRRTVTKTISDMTAGEVLTALVLESPDRAARLRDSVEAMRPDQFAGSLRTSLCLWWPQ